MTTKRYMQTLAMVGQLQVGEKIKLHKLLSQMLKVRDTTADIRDVNIGNPRAVVGQLLKFMKAIGVSEEDVTIASIDRILNRKVGKGALPKCEALWTFISAQTDDRLKREALLQIGFRLHYDELRTWVNVVGIDQMLQFLDRVPACFDSQFPGYASQRLLEKLVSTRKR